MCNEFGISISVLGRTSETHCTSLRSYPSNIITTYVQLEQNDYDSLSLNIIGSRIVLSNKSKNLMILEISTFRTGIVTDKEIYAQQFRQE